MTTADHHPRPRPRRVEVEELFSDPAFAGPTISPDGTRMAYLAPAHGRRNVWVRGIDEDHDQALCVTHDDRRGVTTYHWSDDSRRLLYLQDTDGNEDWHLYRVDLKNPDTPAVDLTPLPPGSRVFAVESFPARPGSVLVTMNKRPMALDLFRIDVATGETTPHHEQSEPTQRVLLDHEGEPAFSSRLTEDGTIEFAAIDPVSGEHRLLKRMGGAEYPLGVHPQLVTPDGTGLVIGAYLDSDDLRLVRIDRETGATSVIAEQEGRSLDTMGGLAPGVLPPTVFTRRGTGEVLAARFVGPRPSIEVLDDGFAEIHARLSALSDGVLGTLSSDDSGQRWIATFLHDRDPGVAWFYDHATGRSRRLFRPFPHLDPADLASMDAVEFTARDGLPLHGFLTLPVGLAPKALPLVLDVHGGPWTHDVWGYNPQAQFLANRGYAVLQVNFRGSTGYGRRHTVAGIGELTGAMQDDLLDAVSWAIDQGYADPNRIGIMGASYGGYATLVGVTATPDRFAAAVDIVGIADLASFLRDLPPFSRPHLTNNWFTYVGDPDDPAQAADISARSPMARVDRITTPLLVAHGANDVRVMRSESDGIVDSLRERGVPVEYLLAEDEGHGFANPENTIRLQRAIERHFAEHLGYAGRPDAADR